MEWNICVLIIDSYVILTFFASFALNSFRPTTQSVSQVVNRPVTTTRRSPPSSWVFTYPTSSARNPNVGRQFMPMTTPKPTKTTTINSFWAEWSPLKPTNLGENEIDRHSTHETIRQTTTPTTTTAPDMSQWMVDILNEYTATTTPRSYSAVDNVVDELPSWMRDVLNEYSTTTTRNNMQIANNYPKSTIFGGGGGASNSDLHRPIQNR